jgi:hypothetical protein
MRREPTRTQGVLTVLGAARGEMPQQREERAVVVVFGRPARRGRCGSVDARSQLGEVISRVAVTSVGDAGVTGGVVDADEVELGRQLEDAAPQRLEVVGDGPALLLGLVRDGRRQVYRRRSSLA